MSNITPRGRTIVITFLLIVFIIYFVLPKWFCGWSVFGATYYVSKAGDNSDGLTWAKAWSDTTTALDSVEVYMSGGDTCFFGAGTWTSNKNTAVIEPPTGASFNDPTLYACSAYVRGLATISGGEVISSWTNYSGNIYSASYTPIQSVVVYTLCDNDSLMDRESALESIDEAGEFWHDATNNIMYAWLYSGENPNTHTMIASSRIIIDLIDRDQSHTHIKYLNVKYGCKIGIRFGDTGGDSPDSTIMYNLTVSKVGGQQQQNTSLLAARQAPDMDTADYGHYTIIRACSLYSVNDESGEYGHTKGVNFYGSMYGLVESCYISGAGIGINFKGQDQGGTYLKGNVARFNEIMDCAQGIDLTCWYVYDSIYGNIMYDLKGMSFPWAIALNGAGIDSGTFVANNTIYGTISYRTLVTTPDTSYYLTGLEGLHTFKYNLSVLPGLATTACIIKKGDSAHLVIDSNYYYYSSINFRTGPNGENTINTASWQAMGFDVNSSFGVDPGLNASYEPVNISAWDKPITYGGRTWYGPGAVQTLWEPTRIKAKVHK